jgi:hypothetical protein
VEFFIPEHDLAELDYTRLWSERQYLAEKKEFALVWISIKPLLLSVLSV